MAAPIKIRADVHEAGESNVQIIAAKHNKTTATGSQRTRNSTSRLTR